MGSAFTGMLLLGTVTSLPEVSALRALYPGGPILNKTGRVASYSFIGFIGFDERSNCYGGLDGSPPRVIRTESVTMKEL
jgi:hypothetical protein